MPLTLQVETAGDCYIVAGGLVDEDEEGFKTLMNKTSQRRAARRVFNFARDMLRAARTVSVHYHCDKSDPYVAFI